MRAFVFLSFAAAVLAEPQFGKGFGKGGKMPKGGGGRDPCDSPVAKLMGSPPGTKCISNDVTDGTECKPIYFIYARGSTEPGNMGLSMGPIICKGLQNAFEGQVGCQGVGEKYTSAVNDNFLPDGTTKDAIQQAISNFQQAYEKCPQAILTFGGYSQGAAVMHGSVKKLSKAIQKRLVGGVLFGDTRNKQDGGKIPNYPKDQVKIFCANDGVCGGKLQVNAGHMAYPKDGSGEKAVAFLEARIKAAQGSSPMRSKAKAPEPQPTEESGETAETAETAAAAETGKTVVVTQTVYVTPKSKPMSAMPEMGEMSEMQPSGQSPGKTVMITKTVYMTPKRKPTPSKADIQEAQPSPEPTEKTVFVTQTVMVGHHSM